MVLGVATMYAIGAVVIFFGFFSRFLKGGRKGLVSIGMILVGLGIIFIGAAISLI